MTVAFDTFLKQYNMTGSEKADGYSSDAFEGLTQEEKVIVFDMLVEQLPWASDWLFRLDPEKALVVAKEIEPGIRAMSGAGWLQREIVRYSGDLVYQQHMIEDYEQCGDYAKATLIACISDTPTNEETVAFLKHAMLTERDSHIAFRAGWALLSALEISTSTEAGKALDDTVRRAAHSENPADRHAALERIAMYQRSRFRAKPDATGLE